MNRSAAEILEDARQLPPGDLDWLVQNLVHEGDGTPEAKIEAAWEVEIKRRLDEIDSGAVKLLPLEDVLARMDARIMARQRG
jgi:putative addiction module component (TIGR02574 family)